MTLATEATDVAGVATDLFATAPSLSRHSLYPAAAVVPPRVEAKRNRFSSLLDTQPRRRPVHPARFATPTVYSLCPDSGMGLLFL
jgi:hypothetical protein